MKKIRKIDAGIVTLATVPVVADVIDPDFYEYREIDHFLAAIALPFLLKFSFSKRKRISKLIEGYASRFPEDDTRDVMNRLYMYIPALWYWYVCVAWETGQALYYERPIQMSQSVADFAGCTTMIVLNWLFMKKCEGSAELRDEVESILNESKSET